MPERRTCLKSYKGHDSCDKMEPEIKSIFNDAAIIPGIPGTPICSIIVGLYIDLPPIRYGYFGGLYGTFQKLYLEITYIETIVLRYKLVQKLRTFTRYRSLT